MMRIEATKFLVSTTKFVVKATKFLVSVTKFSVITTKFGRSDQTFGSPSQKFRSTDQKFSCLNPHHFFVGLTKTEGQLGQNVMSIQPNDYLVVPNLTKGWKRLQNFCE